MDFSTVFSTYGIPLFGIIITLFAFNKIYFHFKLLQPKDIRLEDLSYLEIFLDMKLLFEYFYIIFPFYISNERHKESNERELITKIVRSVYGFWVTFVIVILTSITIT